MKIILVIGSHPRHIYFANQVIDQFSNTSVIIEDRGPMLKKVNKNLNKLDKDNLIKHFKERSRAEYKYFSKSKINIKSKKNLLYIKKLTKESSKVIKLINIRKPNILITFGCGVISEPLLSKLPKSSLNFHTGLLPYFKGTAGNFWPYYFLKPNYIGITIHRIEKKLDGGSIIHQSVPKLSKSDGIHDIACKAILKGVADLKKILIKYSDGKRPIYIDQKKSGKLFLDKDFKPHHLRLIYSYFNNDLAKFYLNNQLQKDIPTTISVRYEQKN